MVDRWFGRVLDALDRTNGWEDTMVVVTADHGHYLGEHGWIGKPYKAPLYDVLAHTPLLVWHPEADGGRVDGLTAAVDLYATMADALGADVGDGRHSRSLRPVLAGDADPADHRDWALYGYWGSSVNVTDGRYTYLHPCDGDGETDCYSTTMMNPRGWFSSPEPREDAEPDSLPYADAPVWRYSAESNQRNAEPLLFDTETDPRQERNLAGESPETDRMRGLLTDALDALEAPRGQYERLGLVE